MSFENPIPSKKEDVKKNNEERLGFEPTRKIESIGDIEEVASWFQDQVEKYIEDHSDYMMGGNFEDLVENIVQYLILENGEKLKGKVINVSTKERYDEETTSGSLYLSGEPIFSYFTGSDGWGPGIDKWNEEILKRELSVLLKKQ